MKMARQSENKRWHKREENKLENATYGKAGRGKE
jgi:hypothetical protein